MMFSTQNRSWYIFAALWVFVLSLGFCCFSVFSEMRIGSVAAAVEVKDESTKSTFATPELKDEQIKLAAVKVSERDPFKNTPVLKPRPKKSSPKKIRRKPRSFPTIRTLVFDKSNPVIQLASGSTVSGWLSNEDVFQGWKVVQIKPNSVRITKDLQVFEIHTH